MTACSRVVVTPALPFVGFLCSQFSVHYAVILQVLRQEPKNGFALVHLGFIVKTGDRDYTAAIPLLQQGIASNVPGVIDGRFFFHLGDALFRTGQHDEVQ